jgi:hypothetical protein
MEVLLHPFVRVWEYTERTGGFPGQLALCVTIVMLIIGGLTWLGNRGGR